MSALGQKQTLKRLRLMSALPPKADIEPARVVPSAHQLRQLGDIRRDPSRLVFCEQLGRRSPARLILEIDISQLLFGALDHDKARF